MCKECYVSDKRRTPLLDPIACLKNHTQYICGTCGRCICIEKDPHRGLQRWNFPFKSLEIAKLYVRAADYTMKKACGIYVIKNKSDRISYKILASEEDLQTYLSKHKDKIFEEMKPIFTMKEYRAYPNTQVRKLSSYEILNYLRERNTTD